MKFSRLLEFVLVLAKIRLISSENRIVSSRVRRMYLSVTNQFGVLLSLTTLPSPFSSIVRDEIFDLLHKTRNSGLMMFYLRLISCGAPF